MLDRFLSPWRKQPEQKAETGIGATWLTYDVHLDSLTGDTGKKAKRAQQIGIQHRWIRAAERVISTTLGSVDWHLETDDDEEVTDESPIELVAIRDLMEKPYRPLEGEPLRPFPRTRSGLWGITSRHMGLCGYSAWYGDEPNPFGIPANLLYLNPARLTPSGEGGNLAGWVLDKNSYSGGIPLPTEQVYLFTLEEADEGWFPAGLVETAMSLVNITTQADRHASTTLGSGGRKPGIFAPAAAAGVIPPDVFAQLEKDLRSSHEAPNAYRRDMILRGPVEFTDRSSTNEQLDLVALENLSRDDTLELWGVPRSQLGGQAPAGLNSGSTKSYDEAALWQKAIHPRITRMYETIQFQLLDPIAAKIGKAIELEIEEPTFDDDAPKYELANSAVSQPLRNVERRALLGLDPIGDPLLDNAIWMPMTIVEHASAPEQKAKLEALQPRLAKSLVAFLEEQKREVANRIRNAGKHVSAKPGDSSVWWDGDKWDAKLKKLLAPYAQQAAELAVERINRQFQHGKATEAADLLGNSVLNRLLAGMGGRITGINETTRQSVIEAIRQGVAAGDSPGAIGDLIEDLPGSIFGEYRGELIARTETATVQNLAAIAGYQEYGVTTVSVIDGDEDEACAAANGSEWTLEEAQANPLEHPNCTRDFSPIVGKAAYAPPGHVGPSAPPARPDDMADVRAMLAEALARIEAKAGSVTLPQLTLSPNIMLPEQPAPTVNVYPSDQLPPTVNVPPAQITVNVPEQPPVVVPAPIVNIEQPPVGKADTVQDVRVVDMPARKTTGTKRVKRDPMTNLITEIRVTEVEE